MSAIITLIPCSTAAVASESRQGSVKAKGRKIVTTLTKPAEGGFGMSFVGPQSDEEAAAGKGVYISKVKEGGCAALDGNVQVGQKIVKVNGKSVTRMTRKQVLQIFKELPANPNSGLTLLELTLREDPEGGKAYGL